MRWFLCFFCLFPFTLNAQELNTPDMAWSSLIGGSEEEEIYDLTELPNGYIAGVGFSTSKWIKGEDQYYFILDADGKKIVERHYGSLFHDRAFGLTSTFDGNFIICGYVNTIQAPKRLSPNIRKIDLAGDVVWSKIESGTAGAYQDLVELSPNKIVVIGEEEGKASVFGYIRDSLFWKKKIPGMDLVLRSILAVSDSTFLITGQTTSDKLLWYALYDHHGNQIWAKRGIKNYGIGLSIAKENDQVYWIGGSYYDPRKREDAYLVKINISNGNMISRMNYGDRYDDVFSSMVYLPAGRIFISGKTYSHIRAGARRSKAWLLEIDPVTGKAVGEPWIWGGRQNNAVTSLQFSGSGSLLLGAWTASGEAERKDGWVMKIPIEEDPSEVMAEGIELVDLGVIEDNGDGKIGYAEASAFRIDFKPSGKSIPAVPKLVTYIDDQKVAFDVLLNSREENRFTIPYYREADLRGEHRVKIVLTDGKNKALDSLERTFEFLGREIAFLDLAHETPSLRDKLDSGQPVIDIPLIFSNSGGLDLRNVRAGIQGLDEIPYVFQDTVIDLKIKEVKKSLLTIKPTEFIGADTLYLQVYASLENQVVNRIIGLPIKSILTPWMNARKEQTTVLLAEKIQSGNLVPLVLDDYRRRPLDSFFMKQSAWSLEKGNLNQVIKSFDSDRLFTIWIDPDPVVNTNYFVSKRSSYTVLLKLINQDQDASGLEPKLLIERTGQDQTDTIALSLDQGVLLGSYQYNLQSEVKLREGENKIRLGLWYRDQLVKSSSLMVIRYEPPKSNLFIYAYGIPDPSLIHVTKDAGDLAGAFGNQEGKLFSSIQSQVYNRPELTTTQAVRKSIRDIVNDFYEFKRIRKDDVLLIYFSSHGSLIKDEFHLHPSDYDPLYEEETTIHLLRDIQYKLKDIPCKKLLFIDACHSGAAAPGIALSSGQKGGEEDLAAALIHLSEASNDFYYLLSSSAGQLSYTDEAWGNSAFTKAILEAFANRPNPTLQGTMDADLNHNQILDLSELYTYLKERVPVIVQSKKNLKTSQTPYTPDPDVLRNIPIYVVNRP